MKFIIIIIIFQNLLFSTEIKEVNKTKKEQTHMETIGGKEDKIVTIKDLRYRAYRSQLPPAEFKDKRIYAETPEGKKGKKDAKNDFRNSIYRLEIYGFRDWNPIIVRYYSMLLLKKYNIKIDRVAGCVVKNGITDHAREYNKVMISALKNKFGGNIFFETKMGAIEMYNDRSSKRNQKYQ